MLIVILFDCTFTGLHRLRYMSNGCREITLVLEVVYYLHVHEDAKVLITYYSLYNKYLNSLQNVL